MLPEGWVECHDPSHGRSYYFNLATQSSQWELPTEPAGVATPPVAESSTPSAEATSPAPAVAAEPVADPATPTPATPHSHATRSSSTDDDWAAFDSAPIAAASVAAEAGVAAATDPNCSAASTGSRELATPPASPALADTSRRSDASAQTPCAPPSTDALVQTEAEPVRARLADAACQASLEPADAWRGVHDMRAQFASMSHRCEGLEAQLECEGAVLLRAFRAVSGSAQAQRRQYEARARKMLLMRDTLAKRVASQAERHLLRLCLLSWRVYGGKAARERRADTGSYVANVTNKMRKEAAPARARVAPAPVSLPQVRERSELYHMSYEALVDTVMEWQRKCGPQTS